MAAKKTSYKPTKFNTMITHFKLIQLATNDPEAFEEEVNKLIKEGYSPQGNLQTIPVMKQSQIGGHTEQLIMYVQGMAKYKDEDLGEMVNQFMKAYLPMFEQLGIIDKSTSQLIQNDSLSIDEFLDQMINEQKKNGAQSNEDIDLNNPISE